MISIPSSEIKQPQFHADPLGFVFVWNGHFLRGIFPESVELAKSYFDSGLIDEITQKGLFPKTWISEYRNEQFGLIIEHELISPVLYATEWNFEMLKDAALMVLELAQIALKYGFNMIDCHKRNVLFKNNKPLYVDIGSFIPKGQGSTGWSPYMSYLHSYYYMLSLWQSGACLVVKRMMAPGFELDDDNYWVIKSLLFRQFPSLIKYYVLIQRSLCKIATLGEDRVVEKGASMRILKNVIDRLKPSRSQRLHSLEKRVKRMRRSNMASCMAIESKDRIDGFVKIITSCFPSASSVVFINNNRRGYYDSVLKDCAVERIVSIQESEEYSNEEFLDTRKQQIQICSCHLRLKDNTILVRGQFPEDRLRCDIAFVPQFSIICDHFNLRNTVGFIQLYLEYSNDAIILGINKEDEELVALLQKQHKTLYYPINNHSLSSEGFLIIYR